HREEPEPARPLNLEVAPPVMDGPRDLPLIRRSSNEPQQQPERDPNAPPSKWDEFFNLQPAADSEDGEGAEEGGVSEGLSAMRDWAKARPEADKGREIPEEFLKPFDWETEEDGAPAANVVPEELLKPFDWEVDETPAEEPVAEVEAAPPA